MKIEEGTKRILWFMKAEKRWGVLFLSLGFYIMALNLYEPLLARTIMDAAFGEGKRDVLYGLAFSWLGIFVLKYGCLYARERLSLRFMLTMMERIQMDDFRHLLHARFPYFRQYPAGYILSRHVNDFYNLEGMMLNRLADGFLGLVQSCVILAFLFQIHGWLGLMAAFLKTLDLVGNYWFPLTTLYKNHNEAAAQMEKDLQDVIGGISLIKCGGTEAREARRYQSGALRLFYGTWQKRDAANILRRLTTGVSIDASYMAVIAAGGWLAAEGQLTAGDIMAFLLFYQKLGGAVNQVIPVIPLFKIGQASAERLHELQWEMGEEPAGDDTGKRLSVQQGISFRHVCFSAGGREILSDVTLDLRPGEVTALVGRSGSGKTTLASLLLRFAEPGSGRIAIDGTPIEHIPLRQLRRSAAYLPQDAVLFQRTLRENIGYHLEETRRTDSRLRGAMAKAAAGGILADHGDSLDGEIAGLGKNLSGGEKQRLCIARELLKDSPIYIFDESTSALDSLSDEAVQQTIRSLARDKGKAVLVIAHRMASVRYADRIHVLEAGRILESGSHESLMEKQGLYYRLYTRQAREPC